VRRRRPADRVQVTIVRNAKTHRLTVTLGSAEEMPGAEPAASVSTG
jgi:S1-C subfamily serine protease